MEIENPKTPGSAGTPKAATPFRLYCCGECGTVSVQNRRDRWCPVCNATMEWRVLRLETLSGFVTVKDGGEAEHEEGE